MNTIQGNKMVGIRYELIIDHFKNSPLKILGVKNIVIGIL